MPGAALGGSAGREVRPFDVIEAYQVVWHMPAPRGIIEAMRAMAAPEGGPRGAR